MPILWFRPMMVCHRRQCNNYPKSLHNDLRNMFFFLVLLECHAQSSGGCWKKIFHSYLQPQSLQRKDMLITWCLALKWQMHWELTFIFDPHYFDVSCHAVRSRITLSRPSFGYLDQTNELEKAEKWHLLCQPWSNAASQSDPQQTHKPICRYHPH